MWTPCCGFLALDEFTADVLREVGGTWLRVVPLTEVEAGDAELAAAKVNRTRVEYFFALSPCWPRWLLEKHGMRSGIERITSVEAEMFFFASPTRIFEAMDAAKASVLVTAQRLPLWLKRSERHGKFNVGLLSFQNDGVGRACLDEWRGRCLGRCHDGQEAGKYADQKYLDEWPERVGAALVVARGRTLTEPSLARCFSASTRTTVPRPAGPVRSPESGRRPPQLLT